MIAASVSERFEDDGVRRSAGPFQKKRFHRRGIG